MIAIFQDTTNKIAVRVTKGQPQGDASYILRIWEDYCKECKNIEITKTANICECIFKMDLVHNCIKGGADISLDVGSYYVEIENLSNEVIGDFEMVVYHG